MDFSEIWNVIAPYVTGTAGVGLVTLIFTMVIKALFNRAINKVDVKKIATEATEASVEKIKEVSFKQSIQPLVESELKKITEQVMANATKISTEELDKLQTKYDNLLLILENFAKYFDDAISITSEKKQELHSAIQSSKQEAQITTVETNIVEDVVVEKPKLSKKRTVDSSITVER